MKGGKRWLEWGKDLVIVLLTVSAGVLIWLSPLVQGSGLTDLLPQSGGDSAGGTASPQALSHAAIPLRMTAGTGLGLYAAQYDQAAVDALFDMAGPLLGEALESAGDPRDLDETGGGENSWRGLLGRPHLYFGYAEPVPLAVLQRWLKPEGTAPARSGSARHILLAARSDGLLVLCWRDEAGGYHLCATGLEAALHLDPILERLTPNSAFFAFEDETFRDVLDPYTLFTSQDLRAPVYQCANPVPLTDSARISQLLSALSFSDLNRASGSAASIYVDGDDTLRLYADGLVRCHAGQGRYQADSGLAGAVQASWSLAQAALEPLCGEARLYLASAREEDGGYTVSFGYCLNGSPVHLLDQGWCARFTVRDGWVTDFTLYPRAYSDAGRDTLLLPAKNAAAALTALSSDPLELVVQYQDAGGEEAEPRWVGR